MFNERIAYSEFVPSLTCPLLLPVLLHPRCPDFVLVYSRRYKVLNECTNTKGICVWVCLRGSFWQVLTLAFRSRPSSEHLIGTSSVHPRPTATPLSVSANCGIGAGLLGVGGCRCSRGWVPTPATPLPPLPRLSAGLMRHPPAGRLRRVGT